ncbi:unnamed protein product, partial [Pylaiella littoralis]
PLCCCGKSVLKVVSAACKPPPSTAPPAALRGRFASGILVPAIDQSICACLELYLVLQRENASAEVLLLWPVFCMHTFWAYPSPPPITHRFDGFIIKKCSRSTHVSAC